MFYKGWNAVDMYQNKNRFSDVQLETCAGNVTRLNDHFRKKGIRLYLLLSPDKERIYSEYYPKSYKQVHPESRLEQLSGCFEKKTPVKTVSLLGPLRDLKKEHPVFFKTGSHWTSRAAHAGVARLLQEIRKDYPDLPSEQPNAEQWIHDLCADVDIAYVAGYTEPEKQLPASDLLYDRPQVLFSYDEQRIEGGCLGECKLTEYTAVKPAPGSLRIFVCSDSFWAYAVPFMFPAANTMLHASFSNGADFDLDLIREQIDSFHPDIVVIESAERFLERFLNIGMEGE